MVYVCVGGIGVVSGQQWLHLGWGGGWWVFQIYPFPSFVTIAFSAVGQPVLGPH